MVMRDLYEVLGVAPEAEDSAIRTAYRKLALRWHPDKNQENLAYAEEQFKEIQNAYEILSDPHERAWYDGHKDAILRSNERHQAGASTGFSGGQRPDDEVDLYAYFTAACYSGFGDGPRGFYGVYDELFQRLAKQEAEASARREDRKDKRPPGPFPRFGFSSAPWEEVAAFYAHWGGFATTKDFSWADQYNPATAPNRRVRRAMEQENDKARRGQRREYNDAVRELVAFLKKRDKRVAARAVEEARRREEREREEKARREREQAERAARLREYREAEWMQASPEGSSAEEESEDEADMLVWHCAACEKHFKSQPAFDNHQRSKKHLENVELLRAVLEEDEAGLASGEGGDESGDESSGAEPAGGDANPHAGVPAASSSNSEGEVEPRSAARTRQGRPAAAAAWKGAPPRQQAGSRKGHSPGAGRAAAATAKPPAGRYKKMQSSSPLPSSSSEEVEEESELDEESLLERLVSTHHSSSRADMAASTGSGSEEEEGRGSEGTGSQEGSDAGSDGGTSKSRSSSSSSSSSSSGEEEGKDEDDEDAMLRRMMAASSQKPSSSDKRRQQQQQRGGGGSSSPPAEPSQSNKLAEQLREARLGDACSSGEGGDGSSGGGDWGQKKKLGKQRGKGKSQKQLQPQPPRQWDQQAKPGAASGGAKLTGKQKRQQRQAAKGGAEQPGADGLACSVCKAEFESRNQLFKHIQTTGHAALKHA